MGTPWKLKVAYTLALHLCCLQPLQAVSYGEDQPLGLRVQRGQVAHPSVSTRTARWLSQTGLNCTPRGCTGSAHRPSGPRWRGQGARALTSIANRLLESFELPGGQVPSSQVRPRTRPRALLRFVDRRRRRECALPMEQLAKGPHPSTPHCLFPTGKNTMGMALPCPSAATAAYPMPGLWRALKPHTIGLAPHGAHSRTRCSSGCGHRPRCMGWPPALQAGSSSGVLYTPRWQPQRGGVWQRLCKRVSKGCLPERLAQQLVMHN